MNDFNIEFILCMQLKLNRVKPSRKLTILVLKSHTSRKNG